MPQSSKAKTTKKPHSDFPLYAHKRGYWAKKVRGKVFYFGKCSNDPQGQVALELWLNQKDDLLAGRKPRQAAVGLTVAELCNRFLTVKKQLQQAGEIRSLTWDHYKRSTDHIVSTFGKTRLVSDLNSDDFESLRNMLTKKWSPGSLTNEVQRIRSIFKYAYEAALIDQPVRFGPMFKPPSKKTLRVARAQLAPRLFSAVEIRQLLKNASLQLQTMVLLAINCGFGNSDCATLPQRAVDLKQGFIHYPRPKTGIDRRCPLWPETLEKLTQLLAKRKPPKHDAHQDLVFVTKAGGSFSKETADNPISNEFAKVVKKLNLQQRGRGFYALRHTFRTIADESRDQPACDHIMGHASEHISTHYRERIDDARLIAVSNYVRAWLFPTVVDSA